MCYETPGPSHAFLAWTLYMFTYTQGVLIGWFRGSGFGCSGNKHESYHHNIILRDYRHKQACCLQEDLKRSLNVDNVVIEHTQELSCTTLFTTHTWARVLTEVYRTQIICGTYSHRDVYHLLCDRLSITDLVVRTVSHCYIHVYTRYKI